MVNTVRNLLIMLNNLLQIHLKQTKVIQKAAEATGDLIGDKIADKITKFLRTSPKNNLETVTAEEENIGLDSEMPRETCISRKKTENY